MALVNLHLIQYNNYFNKILRKPTTRTLAGYLSDGAVLKETVSNASFNENDGVTAYHVINKNIDDMGDYMLVEDSEGVIISTWFITEAKRNRSGQSLITLQRDLLADYYDTIKTAPAFIERGMLDNDDPFIWNEENLSYNQIKTSVKPLLDKTDCAWIIGYMKKPSSEGNSFNYTGGTVTAKISVSSATPQASYESWNDVPENLKKLVVDNENYRKPEYKKLSIVDFGYIKEVAASDKCYYINSAFCKYSGGEYTKGYELNTDTVMRADGTVAVQRSTPHDLRTFNIKRKDVLQNMKGALTSMGTGISFAVNLSALDTYYNFDNDTLLTTIDNYDGAIIQVAGTTYKLSKVIRSNVIISENIPTAELKTAIANKMWDEHFGTQGFSSLYKFVDSSGNELSSLDLATIKFEAEVTQIGLSISTIGLEATLDFPASTQRQETVDAPYNIFAIPFPLKDFGYEGTCQWNGSNNAGTYNIYQEVSIAMARAISEKLSSELLDMQLLPFCPFKFRVPLKPALPYEGVMSKYIKVNDTINSFIVFIEKSSFERSLINVYDGVSVRWNNSKKQSVLDKYRLVGGNYASMFDFNPNMSERVYNNRFHVYCSMKPYKPFVKINPYLGKFYGREEFRDTTGLILSGDMSIDIVSNAWQDYAIQNKNFEQMFDRSILSLDRKNQVAMQNATFGAVAGTVAGGAAGAVAGAKAGPIGAIVGAAVGTAASAVGGALDVNNTAMLNQDNRDLQISMHEYQIGNIKALSNTIQKVSAYTIIDKVVPLLEYYTCTPEEESAFDNYIAYNGMTVGRIDTIESFENRGGFIQGRFIRLEGLSEDYHLANALNKTFQSGFYFYERGE